MDRWGPTDVCIWCGQEKGYGEPCCQPETELENMTFDELIKKADELDIDHDLEQWLDDDYPDKQSELEEKLLDEYYRRCNDDNRTDT